jgi:hypothetical protein
MTAALQNAKGPAEGATSPDRGSINHRKDQEMNSQTNTTGSGDPTTTESPIVRKISFRLMDIEDMAHSARLLNEAIFMAASGIGDRDQMGAIQSVSEEINNKLMIVRDRLEEIRGELA